MSSLTLFKAESCRRLPRVRPQSQVHDTGAAVSWATATSGRQIEPSKGNIGATTALQSRQHKYGDSHWPDPHPSREQNPVDPSGLKHLSTPFPGQSSSVWQSVPVPSLVTGGSARPPPASSPEIVEIMGCVTNP